MYTIARNRDTGKTRESMEAAIENNAIFLCNYPAAVMKEKSICYGYANLECMDWGEFLDPENADKIKGRKVVIDDLDCFANYLCKKLDTDLVCGNISIDN